MTPPAPRICKSMVREGHRLVWLVIWLAIWSIAVSASAYAQPTNTSAKPWNEDVPEVDKKRASELFKRAFDLHYGDAPNPGEALTTYREALELWDRPRYRLNVVILLQELDEQEGAYRELEELLKWGVETFDVDFKEKVERQRARLLAKLAVIDVHCSQPDVKVKLGGEELFTCPGAGGTKKAVLSPGSHIIEASEDGYYAVSNTLSLLKGERGQVTVALSVDAHRSIRLWNRWTPWSVIGGGVAAGLVGGGLLWHAHTTFDVPGCTGTLCEATRIPGYERARRENQAAIGLFVVGGAALVAGTVMLLVNRPRWTRTLNESSARYQRRGVALMPLNRGAGLTTRLTF